MARIPDDKRDAIADDIRARKPRNQIARDHRVSAGTVTNIAREFGLTEAFDRSATKRATEAAAVDSKALRIVTSRRFLDEANRILDRLSGPYLVHAFGGRDNTYREHELALPPAGELRNLITAAAVAFDKHLAGDRHDAGGDVSEVESLLDNLFLELQAKHGDGSEAQ